MFELDPRLESSSVFLTKLTLCQVRLVNDQHYPWLLLIPEEPNTIEIVDLSESDQAVLWKESALVSRVLITEFQPDKLNIAAIGNHVNQCHVHHVARLKSDISWPEPIWGKHDASPYAPEDLSKLKAKLIQHVDDDQSRQT